MEIPVAVARLLTSMKTRRMSRRRHLIVPVSTIFMLLLRITADSADDDVGVPSVVVVGADGADDDIVNPCGTVTSNGANR